MSCIHGAFYLIYQRQAGPSHLLRLALVSQDTLVTGVGHTCANCTPLCLAHGTVKWRAVCETVRLPLKTVSIELLI